MKKLFLALASALVAIGIIATPALAGPEPSVGLFWYETVDPTIGPGVCAPQWQLLIRTDVPSLYAKTGTSCTSWLLIAGGAGTGTVTSVQCLTGLTCTPNPITHTGTIAADGSSPTGTGINQHLTAWTGTSTLGDALGGSTDNGTTTTIGDNLTGAEQFALTGSIAPPALTGSSANDYAPTGLGTTFVIDQSVTSPTAITGLLAQPTGTQIDFRNVASSTSALTFVDESGSSLAANQFALPGAVNWILKPGSSLLFRYNGSNWRLISAVTTDLPVLTVDGLITDNGGMTVASSQTVNAIAGRVEAGSLVLGTNTTANVSGPQNDYNPFSSSGAYLTYARVSTTGATTITGQSAASLAGRQFNYENVGTGVITITNQDAGSSAANRFITPTGGNLTVALGATVHFYYDLVLTRWIVDYVSTSAGSSSGTANVLTAWNSGGNLASTQLPETDDGTHFIVGAGGFEVTGANGQTIVPEVDATGTVTAPATSGSVNNWDPTNGSPGNLGGLSIARESPSAALTLTGLIAGNSGQVFVVRNTSTTASDTITLSNENSSSTAANRFTLGNAAATTIPAGGSCTLRYSGTATRWEPIDDCGVSGMTALPNATVTTTDTGTQNDYTPTGFASASVLLLNPATALTITGLAGGQDGRIVYICTENSTVTITNEGAGSTAANRFNLPAGTSQTLAGAGTNKFACLPVIYIAAASRWAALSTPASSQYSQTLALAGAVTASNGLTISSGTFLFSSLGGHMSVVGGSAPAASSCGSTPSPTVAGTDLAGRLTTGGTATSCTLTFASTYTNAPMCLVRGEGTATDPTYTTSATAITMTVDVAATVYDYICIKVQ